MNILGLNPSHHGSACLLQNGELKYFIQEERIGNRVKYRDLPFLSILNLIKKNNIDVVTWGSPSITYFITSPTDNPLWVEFIYSFQKEIEVVDYSNIHHECHVAHSFYNSGFKKAIGIVIDGLGSNFKDWGQETESIFECSYPSNFKTLYKNIHSHIPLNLTSYIENYNKNFYTTTNVNLSRVYEAITAHLGWHINEAGKTMGLAPYGKFNPNFPPFFEKNTGNPNVFYRDQSEERKNPRHQTTYIDTNLNPQLKLKKDPKEWYYDKSKITDLEKDLAWMVQNDTQQIVGDYVEKAIEETGLKQICCAGGYFLNCVTNYYLKKRFPDVEFYFEPIANDAGTAIGAAKLLWHEETQDTTIRPFKSLYLGKQYSKKKLLKGIKKYI